MSRARGSQTGPTQRAERHCPAMKIGIGPQNSWLPDSFWLPTNQEAPAPTETGTQTQLPMRVGFFARGSSRHHGIRQLSLAMVEITLSILLFSWEPQVSSKSNGHAVYACSRDKKGDSSFFTRRVTHLSMSTRVGTWEQVICAMACSWVKVHGTILHWALVIPLACLQGIAPSFTLVYPTFSMSSWMCYSCWEGYYSRHIMRMEPQLWPTQAV